ncbi:MAG TPA: hypothetical protein VHV50_11100 [Actinomycetota bacterium]|nr:hypothetical protein [Actinomycetota bacterium]
MESHAGKRFDKKREGFDRRSNPDRRSSARHDSPPRRQQLRRQRDVLDLLAPPGSLPPKRSLSTWFEAQSSDITVQPSRNGWTVHDDGRTTLG